MDLLHRSVWEYENKTRNGRQKRGHYVNLTERQNKRERETREKGLILQWEESGIRLLVAFLCKLDQQRESQLTPLLLILSLSRAPSHSVFLSFRLSHSHQLSLCFNLSLSLFPRKPSLGNSIVSFIIPRDPTIYFHIMHSLKR